MKVIVSSSGSEMDSKVSPVFGRAEYYMLVDTEDDSHEPLKNPAAGQSSGAGIQAAQFVLKREPEVLIASNIGPNAFEVLSAGSLECFEAPDGTVREAIDAFGRGELRPLGSANASSHSGISGSRGTDAGGSAEEQLEALSKRLRELRGQVAEIVQQIDLLTKEQQ